MGNMKTQRYQSSTVAVVRSLACAYVQFPKNKSMLSELAGGNCNEGTLISSASNYFFSMVFGF